MEWRRFSPSTKMHTFLIVLARNEKGPATAGPFDFVCRTRSSAFGWSDQTSLADFNPYLLASQMANLTTKGQCPLTLLRINSVSASDLATGSGQPSLSRDLPARRLSHADSDGLRVDHFRMICPDLQSRSSVNSPLRRYARTSQLNVLVSMKVNIRIPLPEGSRAATWPLRRIRWSSPYPEATTSPTLQPNHGEMDGKAPLVSKASADARDRGETA